MTQLFVLVCQAFGVDPSITGEINGGPITAFKVVQCVITTFCVLVPLALPKSMSGAQIISFAALISLTFTLLVLFPIPNTSR